MALLAIVLVATISQFERPAYKQNASESSEPVQHQDNQKPPPSEIGANDWHVWGDSPAQWIMAVFAVLATSVSWWAVVLVNKTLKENASAVEQAKISNELTRADRRPWLSITLEKTVERLGPRNSMTAHVGVNIENFGKTPTLAAIDYVELRCGTIDNETDTIANSMELALDDFVAECRQDFESGDGRGAYQVFPGQGRPKPHVRLIRSDPCLEDGGAASFFTLHCCVVYKTEVDERIAHTACTYLLLRKARFKQVLDGDIAEISNGDDEPQMLRAFYTSIS